MDDEDVYERVAREHPELTGRDRLWAIRELKQQQKAERRLAKNAGRECPACHETVKPVEKTGLVTLAAWAFVVALVTLGMSVVAAAHVFADDTVHGAAIIVLWPVAAAETGFVHPHLFAVLVAFVEFLVVGQTLMKLDERAKRNARCPECDHPMPPESAA
ncbi:hypothetical protein EDD90_7396 [Streptomyces sp. Ag109_O5-1]|uniref:hypothetical protein n=1 Tax=Streptomyces sp. Ag109_O5-1 TaxID=1938851 RepID=UPI000F4E1A4E|nr:hypothetical protein [Streptomyces sp. Ag109_O5-1]RPE44166.1 hypothetical protein EDD90_7396 [Streptomyces sp. Ag109_O5-1]